jgi:hypothetical protein
MSWDFTLNRNYNPSTVTQGQLLWAHYTAVNISGQTLQVAAIYINPTFTDSIGYQVVYGPGVTVPVPASYYQPTPGTYEFYWKNSVGAALFITMPPGTYIQFHIQGFMKDVPCNNWYGSLFSYTFQSSICYSWFLY